MSCQWFGWMARFLSATRALFRVWRDRFALGRNQVEPLTATGESAPAGTADGVTASPVAEVEPTGPRQFTVVLRGPSAAVFEEDGGIVINESNPVVGLIRLHLRTRWRTLDNGNKMPGHIWLEATGKAGNIDEAIEQLSRSALVFLPVVSFAANAAIDNGELELAFDSTPSVNEREYFQSHIPDERGLPRPGRRIDPHATVGLLEAIQHSLHRERILRAVNQYSLALQSWRLGYESMTVAHLWMAAEALTKAVVRAELRRRGLASEADLAAAMGVEIKRLDSTIRREIIFQGDAACYDDGKAASDGLEHGFLGFDEIRNKSARVRSKMATFVRETVFELIELPPEISEILRADPFDKPLGNWSMAHFIRGKLVGSGKQLAEEGNLYPMFVWNVSVKRATPTGGGKVEVQFTESMTAKLGPGIVFKPARHEVWGR